MELERILVHAIYDIAVVLRMFSVVHLHVLY